MAIGTNATVFYQGTEDLVTAGGGTAAVTTTSYSASSDCVEWTNDDDAPMAAFVLKWQYPSGTITTGGVQLMCRLKNIDSTNDEPALTANWTGHFLGNFTTGTGMVATTDYYTQVGPVDLPLKMASQVYEFYLLNSTGVTMSAGWTLKVTPLAYGPN